MVTHCSVTAPLQLCSHCLGSRTRKAVDDTGVIWIACDQTPDLGKTDFPELNRTLTAREYRRVKDYALSLGFENLYLQDKASANAAFVPDWD